MKALLDLRYLARRTVRSQHDLFLSIVESVERVKELFLRTLFAGNELNIINQQNVNRTIAFEKKLGLVVSIPDCIYQFVHEALKRQVRDLQLRVRFLYCMTSGLNQMG